MKKIELLPIKLLAKVFEDYGDKLKRGFRVDTVSAVVVHFFSQERINAFPSLKDSPRKGLMIYGPKGIGKTLNFLVLKTIQNKYIGMSMKIVSAKQLESNYKVYGEAYIQELVNYDELMIDDIGTESRLFKDYGTDRNLVYDILMMRYARFQKNECITHATTNLTPALLIEQYDTRLIDRMKEMFILKKIIGESKR
jgi:DNA replication protein DnaC